MKVKSTDDIIIIPVYGNCGGDEAYQIGQIHVPNYSDHPTWQLRLSAAYSTGGEVEVDMKTKEGDPIPVQMQVMNTTLDYHMADIPFDKV